MGKKSKILYYSCLIVTISFFILDLLPFKFAFFRISFAVTLMLMGIMLIIRAFNLKIDSSLFFGIIFFCCGILNFVIYLISKRVDIAQLWPYYIFSVSFASLITALYFKDKLQLKLCALFLGLGIISLLFVKNIIPLWLMIILMAVWFIGYFIINIIIYKRRKNG